MLIWLAVRPLPAPHRDRYRDEFRAEVCCLGNRQQFSEAASLLAGSFSLSRALQEDDMTTDLTYGKSIGCRLGRHHYQTVSGDNAENRADRHKECLHCGKIKEMDMYEPSDGRYLGGGQGLLLP
jgi:hypothetical protein